ncbi:MAG: T9SS type A sorting domain-containing protein [Candidatus Cloacimonadota bacterium]|nr:T9SS type A sorting domain-containing protein [Candidatus Cloacimonadota bacterium]
MKRITLTAILLISVFTALSAQFNPPVLVNGSEDLTQFAGQQAYKIVGDNVYLTYFQQVDSTREIVFALSENNGQDFSYTTIDIASLNTQSGINKAPVLETLSNGNIIVFYTKNTSDSTSSLFKAISEDQGEIFNIESIAENVFETPLIINNNNVLTLCYSTGYGILLSKYQYFTNWEASENADGGIEAGKVKFWGQDEFFGKVHSNDDIWVQNVGGWPTFHALVTTAGYIMDDGTNARLDEGLEDQIFLGGLLDKDDGIKEIPLEPNADLIRQNGIQPFAGADADIVYVKINGTSFESWLGDIQLVEVKSIPVLSWYPRNNSDVVAAINAGINWFEESDTVWVNEVAIYDTVWTPGPAIGVNNESVWVDAELWIEGSISGKQTWGSSGNAYLTGDITYSGTNPGDEPDDPDNPNYSDYFGLVSEGRIFVKYKHRDPETGEIQSPNCNGIYMYGVYAAIGEGDPSIWGELFCHHDGIFTFEYQHPHGSTPNFESISPYTGNDTTYTFIDLHKFIFPPDTNVPANIQGFLLHGNVPNNPYSMVGYPYENDAYLNSLPNSGPPYIFPEGTDYPWYNPVWPESAEDIVTERGEIHIWGSIIQRRRGYTHRSGSDPYNHPDQTEWNMEEYHYDGTHPPTGYGKDYHYDSRLSDIQPPDFISSSFSGMDQSIIVANSSDGGQNFEQEYETTFSQILKSKSMDSEGNNIAIAYQNYSSEIYILFSDNGGETYQEFELGDENSFLSLEKVKIIDDQIYLLVHNVGSDMIVKFDIVSGDTQTLATYDSDGYVNDFAISNSGEKVYSKINFYNSSYQFTFHYTEGSDEFSGEYVWHSGIEGQFFQPNNSKLAINFDETDSLYVCCLKEVADSSALYLSSGYLDFFSIEPEAEIPAGFSIDNFPNPFNPHHSNTTISFGLPFSVKVEIAVYNIKGEKVKELVAEQFDPGYHILAWNGRDERNNLLPSGVYFYKMSADEYSKTKKMILLR